MRTNNRQAHAAQAESRALSFSAFPRWDISPLREVGERLHGMRVSHAVRSKAGRNACLMNVFANSSFSKGALASQR
jgi:hypothetical protein